MYNVGAAYCSVQRFEESLVMNAKALEFRRRVLPADHPDIGVVHVFYDDNVRLNVTRGVGFFQEIPCAKWAHHTGTSEDKLMGWRWLKRRSSFDSACCLRVILILQQRGSLLPSFRAF
jgi:hypothetical protein